MPRKKNRNKKPQQQTKITSIDTSINSVALKAAKQLYTEAMSTYGKGPLNETLAKLTFASQLYPPLLGLTIIPCDLIRQGAHIARFEQCDAQEHKKLIELLTKETDGILPKKKTSYYSWLHEQTVRQKTYDSNLSEFINDIYLFSAMLNLDSLERQPNPNEHLSAITQLRDRLKKVAKHCSAPPEFVYFQLARIEKLAGNYKLEIEYLKQSAKLGAPYSSYKLGFYHSTSYILKNGEFILQKDKTKAQDYFKQSIEAGSSQGTYMLGILHQQAGEIKEAKEHFRKALQDNNPFATLRYIQLINQKSPKDITIVELKIDQIEETALLKKQVNELAALMPTYYLNNSDETLKANLIKLTNSPGISPLAACLLQALYSEFFYDDRFRLSKTLQKTDYKFTLANWKKWVTLANKTRALKPIEDLIIAAHTMVMYLSITKSHYRLQNIIDIWTQLAKLVEDVYIKPDLPKHILVTALEGISESTPYYREQPNLKAAIDNPNLVTIRTACNTFSELRDLAIQACQAQYAELTHYINTHKHITNPLFHFTAYKHFKNNPADRTVPTPPAMQERAISHLVKAKEGGLTIARILQEEYTPVKTQAEYQAAMQRLAELETISRHPESKQSHPKAILQMGKIAFYYGDYSTAITHYKHASKNGSIDSYRYIANIYFQKSMRKLLALHKDTLLSLSTEFQAKEAAEKERVNQKIEAQKRQQLQKEEKQKIQAALAKQRAVIKAKIKKEKKEQREKDRLQKEAADKAKAEQEQLAKEQLAIEAAKMEAQRKEIEEKRKAKKEKQQAERQARIAKKREERQLKKEKQKAQRLHLEKLKSEKAAEQEKQRLAAEEKVKELALKKVENSKSPKATPIVNKPTEVKPTETSELISPKAPDTETPKAEKKRTQPRLRQQQPAKHYNLFDSCFKPENIFTVLNLFYVEFHAKGHLESRVFYDILSKITSSMESLYRLNFALNTIQHGQMITTPLSAEELAWIGLTLLLGNHIVNHKLGMLFLNQAITHTPTPQLLTAKAIVDRDFGADPKIVVDQFYHAALPAYIGNDDLGYQLIYQYKPAELLADQMNHATFFKASRSHTESSSDESNTLSSPPISDTLESDSSRPTSPEASINTR